MTATGPLLLVGCGKMGGALLSGWLADGIDPASVHVVEPNNDQAEDLIRRLGVNAVAGAGDLPGGLDPAMVMFAVKPQVMAAVAPAYAAFNNPGTVFLSIAAGTPIGFFEHCLGDSAAVVRAMPNTPAAVGRGATVLCANARVTEGQHMLCQKLLSAVGMVSWVDDEDLIHAVTGLSGSGPAYVFHLVEAMAAAGRAAGLPDDLADQLARATVEGSGELLHQSPEMPAQLRRNVTSPNGTTQAGLETLMGGDALTDLMTRTVAAATRRSRELADF
ncbi:MAG: pyrroline-5-carboxylate reductase [Rhodospirillaceae bacterium]